MDKSTLKALIYAKGQELGLDQGLIDQMISAKPVMSEKEQVALQNAKLEGLSKAQSLSDSESTKPLDLETKKVSLEKAKLELQKLKDPSKKEKSADVQKLEGLGNSGVQAIKDVRQLYNEDPNVLSKQLIPGHFLSRKFDAAMYNAADTLLRLRTGAQANPAEIRGYMERLGPSFGDSPDVVEYKLSQMEKAISDSTGVNRVGGEKIAPKQDAISGLAGNAVKDAGSMLNNILGLPKSIVEANVQRMKAGQGPHDVFSLAGEMGKGYASELNQVVGEPLKGGNIVGRAASRAYEKPVTTALDILPFLKIKGANPAPKTNVANSESLLQKTLALPKKTGEGLVENVRKIDVGASPYGPAREAQIAKTLDEVGIKGSPAQQYSQLQPKIEELGGQIKTYLDANSKMVNAKELKNTFVKNITSELPEETMAVPSVEREVSSFVKQISGKDASKLTTADLFDIKKKINASYSRISSKLDRGLPLTDKEKVIYVARKTVDDVITAEHPQIKQATLKQSNLYEASKSLYKQRNNAPALKALGIEIPLPDVRGAQDKLGRLLRGK